MLTASSVAPSARTTSLSRSWVMGRAGRTPCCSKAIAAASTAPIQMGRYRSPCVSLSSRIGWFPGSSTRTPTTLSSCTAGLPQLRPEDGRWIGTGGWWTAGRPRGRPLGPRPPPRDAGARRARARWCCAHARVRSRAGGLARARTGQVDEAELADLHLVAPGQRRDVDRLAVDVGAVEAADVVHREAAALAVELHVPTADGDVVEEDVAVGVPAGGGDVLVEQEAAAGVRAPLDDQQRRAGRQGLDRSGVSIG